MGQAAHCFIDAGNRARLRHSNEQAVRFYKRGLELLSDDDVLPRIDALHNLGDVLALVGNSDEAFERFEEMLRLAWLVDHASKGGAAHGRLGRLCRQRGDLESALAHFRQAHELFARARDRRGLAGVFDDVGRVYWLRGEYPLALEHHRRALDVRKELGDKRSMALSLANVGRVLNDSGQFTEAVEQFRAALEIRREIGDRPGEVESLCDLGGVYGASGNLGVAREIFSDALEIAKEIGDRPGQAHVLLRLGESELQLSRAREAAQSLEEAQSILETLGDRMGQAECLLSMAEVCLVLGHVSHAEGHAQRALEIANELGFRSLIGRARRVLGEVGAAMESPGAEDHLLAAIQVFRELNHDLELSRALRACASLREHQGRSQEGKELLAHADRILGRLRGATA